MFVNSYSSCVENSQSYVVVICHLIALGWNSFVYLLMFNFYVYYFVFITFVGLFILLVSICKQVTRSIKVSK